MGPGVATTLSEKMRGNDRRIWSSENLNLKESDKTAQDTGTPVSSAGQRPGVKDRFK